MMLEKQTAIFDFVSYLNKLERPITIGNKCNQKYLKILAEKFCEKHSEE